MKPTARREEVTRLLSRDGQQIHRLEAEEAHIEGARKTRRKREEGSEKKEGEKKKKRSKNPAPCIWIRGARESYIALGRPATSRQRRRRELAKQTPRGRWEAQKAERTRRETPQTQTRSEVEVGMEQW